MVRLTPVKLVAGANDAPGTSAVGPSKYPECIIQFVGRLAGVPVLPQDATLVIFAPAKLVSLRFVPATMARVRFALLRSVEARFAPTITAFVSIVPVRFSELRFARDKFAAGPIK